jgi:hypothetical protein
LKAYTDKLEAYTDKLKAYLMSYLRPNFDWNKQEIFV